jgi:hypothetical protein
MIDINECLKPQNFRFCDGEAADGLGKNRFMAHYLYKAHDAVVVRRIT